jgi:hypothetical protein
MMIKHVPCAPSVVVSYDNEMHKYEYIHDFQDFILNGIKVKYERIFSHAKCYLLYNCL